MILSRNYEPKLNTTRRDQLEFEGGMQLNLRFRVVSLRFATLVLFCILYSSLCFGQGKGTISGVVSDENGNKIEGANVVVVGLPGGTSTDKFGRFSLTVQADTLIKLHVSYIGLRDETREFILRPNEKFVLNVPLTAEAIVLDDAVVQDTYVRTTTLTRINPKLSSIIPSISSDQISALIKSLPGVASSNDLSSQYNVRGGNYDENLVFVNDIEIYKPFLIKQGQQEGLGFVNSDLTGSLLFSAGGFEAKFGDKMSSVLDVKYKQPKKFGASLELSLTSVKAHLELADKKNKVGFLFGVRQKSNQYVLKSLQTKGTYKPSFTDVQTFLTWKVNDKIDIGWLGYYSHNRYWSVPENRETTFGTMSDVKTFKVYFEGQERDYFNNYTTGLTLNYKVNPNLNLKFIASYFASDEHLGMDILGEYWIGQVPKDSDGDGEADKDSGESKNVITEGVGGYRDHVRDNLFVQVISAEHKGNYGIGKNFIQWGFKYQHETIDERISEWSSKDSSLYLLPNPPDYPGTPNPTNPDLYLEMNVRTRNNYATNRLSAFIQDDINFETEKADITLSLGARFNYWDFNNQFNFSPRANLSIKPDWKHDFVFRLGAGYYIQPPFYHEVRDWQGVVHKDVKAQESVQFVFATDYIFPVWGRPFKFTAEAYYKYLMKLNPYEVNNVKVQYYATNDGTGYAVGLDLKLYGEFIKGVESWVGLSIMNTAEKIKGWQYSYIDESGAEIFTPGQPPVGRPYDSSFVATGYMPRPTDQRFNFNLFFQDCLPWLPTLKAHLNLVFGTGLPFTAPYAERVAKNISRAKGYSRVDLGFSYQIIGEGSTFKNKKNPFAYFDSLWVTAEIFNLFGFKNVLNYTWISDLEGRRYAIPNYQTPRQFNIRLVMQF